MPGRDPSIDRPSYAPQQRRSPWRSVVTRDGCKYVALEGQPWLMFNLNKDPYECPATVILMR